MNIIIIMHEPFPLGYAVTNRILTYSKPIVDLGNRVKVICLRPTEIISNKINNKDFKGEYDGVFFEYSSGTTLWPKHGTNRLQKLYLLVKGLFNSIKIIKFEKKKFSVDCLLLVSNSLIEITFFYLISKLLNVVFIQEKSEYPFVLRNKSIIGRLYAYFYVNTVYKLFDGMIIETRTLIKYFSSKIGKKTQICCVPMTVETERFVSNSSNIKNPKYIAYCGNMEKPDGISILIDAFSIVANKFTDINLYLIGAPSNNSELENYKSKVHNYSLEKRVVFTGKVTRDEVPDYLCNATILALASPKSLRSQGSLPSKLGEYLSTSNPVVITKNGEISDYLEDGVNSFLAEPDSVESFAEKLEYVLSHPENAKTVGENGRKVAIKHFNSETQAKRILDFVNKLNK